MRFGVILCLLMPVRKDKQTSFSDKKALDKGFCILRSTNYKLNSLPVLAIFL